MKLLGGVIGFAIKTAAAFAVASFFIGSEGRPGAAHKIGDWIEQSCGGLEAVSPACVDGAVDRWYSDAGVARPSFQDMEAFSTEVATRIYAVVGSEEFQAMLANNAEAAMAYLEKVIVAVETHWRARAALAELRG